MAKKILLIELAGIGDAVLSTPTIRNIRKNYPHDSIYFLCFEVPAIVVRTLPYLDRIYVFKRGIKNIFKNIIVLNKVRKLNMDIAINLYQHYTFFGSIKMLILFRLIMAKRSVGRNTDGKGFFYDIKIDDKIRIERHDVEIKLDLIKTLDCKIEDKYLEVRVDKDTSNRINNFLKKNFILDKDILIGINPGGRRKSRRWNIESFSEVADILSKKYHAKIVITGSKQEKGLVKRMKAKMSTPAIDGTLLTLKETIALIRRCDLYVTNDTGPMHIANALNIPIVAIVAGAKKTFPYKTHNCVLLRKNVDCEPCYKNECRTMKCIKNIDIKDVINGADTLLKDHGKD